MAEVALALVVPAPPMLTLSVGRVGNLEGKRMRLERSAEVTLPARP